MGICAIAMALFSELDEWLHTLAGRGLWQMGGVKGHNHFWPSFVLRLFLIACFWFGPEATDSITYLVPIVEVLPFFGRKEAGSSSFIYWPSLPVFLRLFHFTLVQCRTEKKKGIKAKTRNGKWPSIRRQNPVAKNWERRPSAASEMLYF